MTDLDRSGAAPLHRSGSSWTDGSLGLPTPPAWYADALCAQTDPEAFFPEKGGSNRQAKRVCRACDVRDPCLEYALTTGERYGIWGGQSERERERLARTVPVDTSYFTDIDLDDGDDFTQEIA